MNSDPSGALLQVDGVGTYKYSLVTSDGKVYNWTTKVWEAMPKVPLADHLQAMTTEVFGVAAWSAAIVPPVTPLDVWAYVLALIYSTSATGGILSYVASAVLPEANGKGPPPITFAPKSITMTLGA